MVCEHVRVRSVACLVVEERGRRRRPRHIDEDLVKDLLLILAPLRVSDLEVLCRRIAEEVDIEAAM